MATPAQDKYYLRSVHQEIDLFDRKLAHLLKYDTFATDLERSTAANKMKAKRELLVSTARLLVGQGIEFKPSELPRSLRTGDEVIEPKSEVAVAEAVQRTSVTRLPPSRQFASPFAGGVLDGQAIMQTYKRTRVKTPVAQA